MKKKKSGASLIVTWQEPSVSLLKWSMSIHGYHVALHLSNLQKVCLAPCALSDADARNKAGANILDVNSTRNTYTKLAQGPVKIKDCLLYTSPSPRD